MRLGLVMPMTTCVRTEAFNGLVDVILEACAVVSNSERPADLIRACHARGEQPMARTVLGQACIDKGMDWLLWIDDDMVIPQGAIAKMIDRVTKSPEIKMLSALYFSRSHADIHGDGEYPPCAFVRSDDNLKHIYFDYSQPPSLYSVSAVGFGCVLMHKDVWNDVMKLSQGRGFVTTHTTTEDVWFCNYAVEAGHKIWLDTSIVCGHLKVVSMDIHNIPLIEQQRKIVPCDNFKDHQALLDGSSASASAEAEAVVA